MLQKRIVRVSYLYTYLFNHLFLLNIILVCAKVLADIIEKIPSDKKSDQIVIDKLVRSHCKELKGKENKFCNYIGALSESATSIMSEVNKPLSW